MDTEWKPRLMSGLTFAYLYLLDGSEQTGGPWRFVSDGVGCMYPRFVNEYGTVVPWHAVSAAFPVKGP